mmetsp:Transcript_14665/g.31883  ORF Transcript_14665/g.31883 Transcript_14665/m.31883 type:complete len:172 (+) Transcript_14665:133-648(+)
MRAQNLICCATLAFVNNINGGKRYGVSYLGARQKQSQLSLNGDEHNCYGSDRSDINLHEHSQHRRAFVQTIATSFLTSVLLTNDKPASAACLSGDIRAECIGIYKLPVDAAEAPYMVSQEQLKKYAPDLQWVPPVQYPSTYADALNQLKDQRQQLDVARDCCSRPHCQGRH